MSLHAFLYVFFPDKRKSISTSIAVSPAKENSKVNHRGNDSITLVNTLPPVFALLTLFSLLPVLFPPLSPPLFFSSHLGAIFFSAAHHTLPAPHPPALNHTTHWPHRPYRTSTHTLDSQHRTTNRHSFFLIASNKHV